jgi:hypothetical protein
MSTTARALLIGDLKDDLEFDGHAEGKAGDADDQPNRCFLDAKDIAKEVGDSIRNPGLVEEVSGSGDEDPEPNDARDSIE